MTYVGDDLGYSPDADHPDPRDLIDAATQRIESEREGVCDHCFYSPGQVPDYEACSRMNRCPEDEDGEPLDCQLCDRFTTIGYKTCPTCLGTGRR